MNGEGVCTVAELVCSTRVWQCLTGLLELAAEV